MNAVVEARPAVPRLKDASVFGERGFVEGAWIEADSRARFKVDNPADGSIVGTVPDCGAAETHRAVDAANAALPAWRALLAKERAAILRRWFDLMVANADDLAQLLTPQPGKPLVEAKGESLYRAALLPRF